MKSILRPMTLLMIAAGSVLLAQSTNSPESKIVEYDFAKIRIKHQPSWPPYPADWPPLKSRAIVTLSITINTEGKPVSVIGIDGPTDSRRYAEMHLANWLFYPVVINDNPASVRFKMVVPVSATKTK